MIFLKRKKFIGKPELAKPERCKYRPYHHCHRSNDPATRVTSLHALSDLLAYRLHCHPRLVMYGEDNMARIEVKVSTFNEVFDECIQPIWNYGKADQYIQKQLCFMIEQLKKADDINEYADLFDSLLDKINAQTADASD